MLSFCSISSVWLEHRSYEPEVSGSSPLLSTQAFLAEWFKAPDLRSGIVRYVGSNPTECKGGWGREVDTWSHGLMVMTEDFESSNPSSNLGKSYFYAGMPESGLRGAT